MIRRLAAAFTLLLAASAAHAGTLVLDGRFVQGGLVRGETEPGTEITLGDRTVRVSPEGRFAFGFGRDHGRQIELVVRYPNGESDRRRLEIEPRSYRIQRIEGLPPRKVTPNAEDLKRIRAEGKRIADVRALDTAEALFAGAWIWPCRGTVTGVFGSQRILNGEPRRPHYGIDIAAPTGTPVVAPAAGVVRLADPDLFFTGGTVMLDHGHGVTSVYSHLHTVTVDIGQRIAQGEAIGTVGSTGRSTGPHLDWRINWFTERLDPALLVPPMNPPPLPPRRPSFEN